MESNKLYEVNKADILFENFDDEIVLINLKSGYYYSINESGMIIWDLLINKHSTRQINVAFRKAYPGMKNEFEQSVDKFVIELETEGLIVSVLKNVINNDTSTEFHEKIRSENGIDPALPVLEKYTDQQELLLLDPIHEVSDLGWPERKGEGTEDE